MDSKEARPTVWAFVLYLACGLLLGAMSRSFSFGRGALQLLPVASLPIVAFAALIWPPPISAALAYCLGTDLDLAAAAPMGLSSASLVLATWVVASLRWRWFGRGAKDLALASALLYLLTRCAELALLALAGRPIGVISLAEAALLPGMALHGGLGWLARAPLEALWRWLVKAPPRSLSGARHG